ncbi:tigger transposable element-derived protein 1-like isoform X4 [Penaeus chinensis]|uniref:tigger transposable element-derived protein 1-like isoform X4 n=1 Tax=Penaeus chinensis TaxID=139456 RepID=UPI001FB63F45|nr:tigger transposable element-derived protein 1-like isoform X4 [Penaeus chinensis]
MVYRCVVLGCKKVAVPGVRSVHKIPSEKSLRNEWQCFVNKTRPGWTGSESSRICSEHFTPDNYGNFLAWQMGKARKLDLKPSAIPTVYPGEAWTLWREEQQPRIGRRHNSRVWDSDSSSSEWERSDDDNESEKKDDCCLAALVLSPVSTSKRKFRVKRVSLDHHAVPCGSSRCHVLQSDCSSNKMENRDGKGELKVKDEPEEECAIALGKGREMEFLELGNKAMEDSHHSLQGWLNSSDQDEFEVKDEPVEEDYVCAFDSNGIKINEEEISSSPQNTSAFLIQLQHSIREGNYTPDQVFVLSKTGLFWKRLPGQTFISKKEEFSSGFKARNDRFSLLLCANASGDSRLKPFLVYYTSKLKDLKVTSFQMLPVHWRYNRRASLTTIMFEDWFANCAIPEILAYCKQKNIEEKALILVDSVIGQSDMINEIHPYVKVIFMPSDISPSIQPPDQFAITQFLQLYTKTLLQNMLIFTEGGDESHVEDFLKSYSIKEALFTIRDSWTAIKIPFLNKFWSYVWPGKTQNFTVHPNASGEIQEIRDLANRIPGQGFTDLTEDDIHRHLKSLQEELSTEESAQMTKATEGDDDNQQDTPTCSMPPTSELESIVKLLYKTERKIIETEWNPKRLEQSLPHLSSIKAMYMDILKTRKKR